MELIAGQFRARHNFDAEVLAEHRGVRFSFTVQHREGPIRKHGEVAFAPDTTSRAVTVTQVTFNRNTEERQPLSGLSPDAIREHVVTTAKTVLDL